ncbi:hypothetical protein GCM10011614_35010 [Novosphingobium colocasiae]|uniref:EamA domain-containing protein n=2 Tax=Novosphingobium colocasiae TaxID=1256513 RepID=A0A918UKY7_9SPHN|nr:hypothetical protein GCM10011614_35010 [Novosphingobium colocasiae]
METASGLTARLFVLFAVGALGQVGGGATLGRTEGFTNPLWTAICLLLFAVSIGALAKMVQEGGPISIIMPALAATVPLALVFIGVFFLGESASWPRIGLLALACIIIGISGTL